MCRVGGSVGLAQAHLSNPPAVQSLLVVGEICLGVETVRVGLDRLSPADRHLAARQNADARVVRKLVAGELGRDVACLRGG